MIFKDHIDEMLSRLGKDSGERERVGHVISKAYQFVGAAYFWKALQKRQELVLVADIQTGTASVTQGSRIVTISGYTLTSDLAGRFFSLLNGSSEHQIQYVDVAANQLILESEIVEETAAGLSYKIQKRIYSLYSNVRQIEYFGSAGVGNYRQSSISKDAAVNVFEETPFSESGTDQFVTPYTTGQVALTKNSFVAIGVGTAWLTNARPGGKMTIQSKEYRVRRVESDTRMILLNASDLEITSDYEYSDDNPRQIEVLTVPGSGSKNQIIPIDYFSHVYPMLNEEKDKMEVSHPYFEEAVYQFAEARYLADSVDTRATSGVALARAQGYLEGLKANSELVAARYRQFPPTIPPGNGRGN